MALAYVRVEAFRGIGAFPLQMSVASGRMAAAGVAMELTWTRSSDELVQGLIEGRSHVVQASPDNFVAWRDRTTAPIRVWYGGSSGPIKLVLGPGVPAIESLRGRQVAVDYPNTGWAPILVRIIGAHGVAADEIEQVPTGATAKVFAALMEGRSPAAMLNEPWASRAVAGGCRVIADHRSVAPALLTSAGAALQPWLDAERATAAAILRSIIATTDWLLDPGSSDDVVEGLARFLDSSTAEARALYGVGVDAGSGWPRDARPDPAGVAAWIGLRRGVADPPRAWAEPYVDEAIHERVVAAG